VTDIDATNADETAAPESELHVATFDELDPRTLYSILKLRSDVFIVEQECAYQDLDGRDDEPGTRHLWLTTAATGPAPMAYLRVLDEPDGVAIIGRVVVAQAGRRRGYAQLLLARAVELIGERESILNAQTYAKGLYESQGFEADGPEFLDDGIPHIPMRRLPRK
jgi:ElaA protein